MRKHWFWAVSLLCAALLLTACGTGPVESENGNTDGGNVCSGTKDCACSDDSQCNNGLSCQQGKCQTRPAEEPSTPTDAGDTKEEAPKEEAPKDEPPCEAGSLACRCLGNGLCNAGLRCDTGVCQTCPEGTPGCACKSDKTCNTGLQCESGVCKGCVGKSFCPCYGNNSCDKGNLCEFSSSGNATCQPCKDRTDKTGCNCELDSECGGGKLLCLNKRCADASKMSQVPKNPRCYSPCEGDIQNGDGTIRTCHPKTKLKEGCDPGQSCVEGSCLTKNEANQLSSSAYPFCMKQADCPDWQACLGGRCYSNCGADSDCQSGFKCHRHVCRRICDLTKSQCTKEESCLNTGVGDEDGLCMPLASRNNQATPISQTLEVFEISNRKLDLTNLEKVGYFAISNQSNFDSQMSIIRHSDSLESKTPLSWLRFDLCKTYNTDRTACTAYANTPTNKEPFTFTVPGKSAVFIRVVDAEKGPSSANRYEGLLTIKSKETSQIMAIGYRKTGSGRWKGKLFSFGNFDDNNIAKFPNSTGARVADFSNAFLRRWLNFKNNAIDFDKFRAMLLSMQEGTWKLPKVLKDCRTLFSQQATEDVVCYPYASPGRGYEVFSYSQREAAVPTGLSALNFTMDVVDGPSNTWTGKVHSGETLQYPGNPSINISFASVPGGAKKTVVSALKTVIDLGGRHLTDSKSSCPNSSAMDKFSSPWLLLDFVGSAEATTGLFREQYECRNKLVPASIPSSATAEQRAAIERANASLSSANPIPNGRTLRRTIELVDGMLYDNRYFFAIVRERFVSPFEGVNRNSLLSKDWVRYGYLWLERTDTEITAKEAKGNDPKGSCQSNADCSAGQTCQGGVCQGASQLKQATCDPVLVNQAIRVSIQKSSDIQGWTQSRINNLVSVMITGQTAAAASQLAGITGRTSGSYTEYRYSNSTTNKTHYVHYYCEDTKQFNGGPVNSQTDCPSGSKVVFFELPGVTESQMRGESCNRNRNCDTRFAAIQTTSGYRGNVPYRCKDTKSAFCDGIDRKDLRSDKVFFQQTSGNTYVSPFQPIRDAIRQAFRYRFKFMSRSGGTIGFTPVICAPGTSSQTPYCYDPSAVESIEKRVNCLEYLYSNTTIRNRMSGTARGQVRTFLQHAFAYSNSKNSAGDVLTDFGFETLNAELRVMLGDEAYIRALNNRYDLAGTNLVSFDGDKLEPNGIKLSGVLGHEMHNLYLSVQYYQSVLDRFYAQTPLLTASFTSQDTTFITAASVTSYIKKLLLAATRKARSWSQIAKQYHNMKRIDLARHVLERNYVGSYLEMMVITRLLRSLIEVTDPKQKPQLRQEIDTITITYNAALLDMQETYEKVQREVDEFGFEPGYIPFPAMDNFSTLRGYSNAVTVSLNFAKQKMYIARTKEQNALQSKRQFDTDAAKFQSELVKIDNTYNEQLIQICGAIKDGNRSVPAIPRYAALLPKALQVANPCGKVSGSYIYNAYLSLEKLALEAQQLEAMYKRAQERITDEETRIQTFCNNQFSLADVSWEYNEDRKSLKFRMSQASTIRASIMRGSMGLMQIAMGWKCDVILGDAFDTECSFAGISNAIKLATLVAQEAATTALNLEKRDKEKELMTLQGETSKFQIKSTCDICPKEDPTNCTPGVARVISQNYLKRLTIDLERFALRALNMKYNMRLAASNIERLKQRAQRLIQQQNDALVLLSNVQATANDPNQRIYKNDAVINAEFTFNEAMREAYRATLVYEYYTSQTYKNKNDLFLIRMISSGDKNLEAYLSQLERAFKDFEETQGKPDIRVAAISLRDDILKLKQVDKDGKVLTVQQRINLMREKLASREFLNKDGYLSFNFTVSVGADSNVVSPVTHNHKVLYIAADISHTSAGSDDVARVYIQQKGTGVVRASDGTFAYYALPQRTSVINATLNGDRKPFDPAVYRSFRLQDRPLANTQWVLQFNQSTEKSNQDIDLNSISDIVVYIYYTDFTKN